MDIRPIESAGAAAWQERLLDAPFALIYKHSPICAVSAAAWDQVSLFSATNPEVPVYGVDVIRERGTSQRLAQAFRVRHASPQVILLRGGSPVWVASHLGVTAGAIQEAVHAAQAPPNAPAACLDCA